MWFQAWETANEVDREDAHKIIDASRGRTGG